MNNAKAILSFECTRSDVWRGRKAGDRDVEQISQKDAGGDLLKSLFLLVGLGMEIGPWQ